MAVNPTYPGVYIQEMASTSHVISGVTTADTAFVDVFERGPANQPQQITNFGQFTAVFGPLNRASRASYGIYQFFLNGGTTAWVVRVTSPGDVNATCKLADFGLESVGPGDWGNNLQAAVQASEKPGYVDLVVREMSPGAANDPAPSVTAYEAYPQVSLDSNDPAFVVNVLAHQSQLVRVRAGSVNPPPEPAAPGIPVTRQESILNPNNISNPKSEYGHFTGGKATLSFSSASQLGAQGDPAVGVAPTGMYTLDSIEPAVFNLLCVPAMAGLSELEWDVAFDAGFTYCQAKMAFLIADPPTAAVGATDPAGQTQEIQAWFGSPTVGGQTNHAAVYFPRIMIPDPAPGAEAAPFETETSGALAGLYARTDASQGVWNTPAGRDANLIGVLESAVTINDIQNGELNPLGINCLRTFPTAGVVSWGSRTMQGANQLASEWKYLSVRRLALYIEQSLQQGTTWAVFEPNDEALWASLRLAVGSFMDWLYKQGAFLGTTAKDGYFVKCDATTTSPRDQQRGRVNITVGFAPLQPAEFIVITISQVASQ